MTEITSMFKFISDMER